MTNDLLPGDECRTPEDVLSYTILETMFNQATVDVSVRWAMDQGQTMRTIPLNLDLDCFVRPEPPEEEPPPEDPPEEPPA